MSKSGEEIFELTTQVRKLCLSVEALLLTADGAMKKEGYSSIDNVVSYGSKRTLGQAEVWFPPFFYRYYATTKRFVPFVAITVDRNFAFRKWSLQFETPLDKPLVMVGIMDLGKGSTKGKKRFAFWNCLAFGDLPQEERKCDGNWIPAIVRNERNRWAEYAFKRAFLFALPLTEIRTPEQIESRITEPLLRKLRTLHAR